MELQEIEITITPTGQVKLQVRGVDGTSCLDLTRELELALGGNVVSREMTAEADGSQTVADQDVLHLGR